MRSLLIIVSLLIAMSVFAWRENIADCPKIGVGTDSMGNKIYGNYLSFNMESGEINVPDQDFSYRIFQKLPFIAIAHDRELVIYNYVTGERKTKTKIPKNARFKFATADGFFLNVPSTKVLIVRNNSQFYNFEGEKLWEAKNVPSIITVSNDIVLSTTALTISDSDPCKWTGHDAKTGNQLWETKTNAQYHHIYSCKHTSAHNPTKIYLIGDSLMCLDITTGEAVSHPFKAGKRSSLLKAYLWGGEPDTIYDPNLSADNRNSIYRPYAFTGLHSNWIEKGDTLFIADVNNLYAFDKQLKPYWSTALPNDSGAKSGIRLVNDKLLLFNYGVGFYRGNVQTYGKPFAASLSITDGKLLSTTYPTANDHMIGGYYTNSGRIYWLTRRELFYCDEGESELHKIDWKSRAKYYSADQKLRYAIQDTVWVVKNNFLEPVVTDDNQIVIEDWDKDVYVLQLDGTEQVIPADKVYFKKSDYVYFNNGLHNKSNRKTDRQIEYLILDSVSGKINYKLFTTKMLAHNKNQFVIQVRGGLGFVDLNNCSESN